VGRETAETCGLQAYVRLIEYQFLSKSLSKSSAELIERMRKTTLLTQGHNHVVTYRVDS
jgi:hypothetical protein